MRHAPHQRNAPTALFSMLPFLGGCRDYVVHARQTMYPLCCSKDVQQEATLACSVPQLASHQGTSTPGPCQTLHKKKHARVTPHESNNNESGRDIMRIA
eukprot:1157976-Pelagomonas_calceolata.AAC.1